MNALVRQTQKILIFVIICCIKIKTELGVYFGAKPIAFFLAVDSWLIVSTFRDAYPPCVPDHKAPNFKDLISEQKEKVASLPVCMKMECNSNDKW